MENYYVKRIINVLIYIEDHIEDELSVNELAKVASYSPFHFHRVFHAVMGETVHKYVRRLRLEKAAGKLRRTNQPITDIALDARFDTSSSFAKAFKQCMGQSARNYRLLYKEVNAMTKKMSELPMIYPEKTETISDKNLLCIRRFGSYIISSENAWNALLAFIDESKLDRSKQSYISIFHDDPQITNEERLRFDACIQAPKGVQEKGDVARQMLKGGKYAIFIHNGSHHTIEDTFDRIFLKWFPNSKETFDEARPFFCEHFNLDEVDKDESKLLTKIYIPVS